MKRVTLQKAVYAKQIHWLTGRVVKRTRLPAGLSVSVGPLGNPGYIHIETSGMIYRIAESGIVP